MLAALKQVFSTSRISSKPLLMVRGDNPETVRQMRNYFRRRKNSIYVRLGIICPWPHMFEEIYMQVTHKRLIGNSENIESTVRNIIDVVKRSKHQYSLIVDNCHLIEPHQISYLIGLVLELEGKAQFIFLVSREHLTKWLSSNGGRDLRLKYFLKMIARKYAIPHKL
jgi:hypothetical protein